MQLLSSASIFSTLFRPGKFLGKFLRQHFTDGRLRI